MQKAKKMRRGTKDKMVEELKTQIEKRAEANVLGKSLVVMHYLAVEYEC